MGPRLAVFTAVLAAVLLGFGFWGFGIKVPGLGFKIKRVWGLVWVYGLGLGV